MTPPADCAWLVPPAMLRQKLISPAATPRTAATIDSGVRRVGRCMPRTLKFLHGPHSTSP